MKPKQSGRASPEGEMSPRGEISSKPQQVSRRVAHRTTNVLVKTEMVPFTFSVVDDAKPYRTVMVQPEQLHKLKQLLPGEAKISWLRVDKE